MENENHYHEARPGRDIHRGSDFTMSSVYKHILTTGLIPAQIPLTRLIKDDKKVFTQVIVLETRG